MATSALVLALALALAAGADATDVTITSQPTTNQLSGACLASDSTDYNSVGDAATYDYFPDKFVTSAADLFKIEYHKTYKVITQTNDNKKTVAYQCGTAKPAVAGDLFVEVPVTKVAATSTTYFPWIELLGERASIKHYKGAKGDISSTCLKKNFDDTPLTDSAAYPPVAWCAEKPFPSRAGVSSVGADATACSDLTGTDSAKASCQALKTDAADAGTCVESASTSVAGDKAKCESVTALNDATACEAEKTGTDEPTCTSTVSTDAAGDTDFDACAALSNDKAQCEALETNAADSTCTSTVTTDAAGDADFDACALKVNKNDCEALETDAADNTCTEKTTAEGRLGFSKPADVTACEAETAEGNCIGLETAAADDGTDKACTWNKPKACTWTDPKACTYSFPHACTYTPVTACTWYDGKDVTIKDAIKTTGRIPATCTSTVTTDTAGDTDFDACFGVGDLSTKTACESVKKALDADAAACTYTPEYDSSVTFEGAWDNLYRGYKLAETHEDEVLEVAEYVGMIAAVYNREKEANELFTAIKDRYTCVKGKIAARTANAAKPAPKVLWFSWVGTADGGGNAWDAGKCPNYYCETITDAGGQPIDYKDVTKSAVKWGYNYFSDAEILSLAKDADYAIVSSYGWGKTQTHFDETDIKATLDQIKAFKDTTTAHPRVFDTDGFGSNDWFESRIAEPDVLLEDVVAALWPSADATHTGVWIKPRGVASKTKAACTDVTSLPTLQANKCSDMAANIDTIEVKPPSSAAVGFRSVANAAATAAAASLAAAALL